MSDSVPTSQVAAEAGNVSQLVYLASHMLEVGESVTSSVTWGLPTEGALPPSPAREALFADLSDEEAAWAEAQLVPQRIRAFTEPLTTAAWETIPSAFVRCEEDQIFPPVLDERAGAAYRLPSSHSPFLSMPKELAALIGRIVGTAPGDR